MAKTTSQIISENRIKRAEEAVIDASRNAIHQQQMAEVGEMNADRTQAVLDGTSEKLVKNIETTETLSFPDVVSSPLVHGIGSFFLGALIVFVYFKIKIKRIKADYEIRINEARSSLDRMLKIATKD